MFIVSMALSIDKNLLVLIPEAKILKNQYVTLKPLCIEDAPGYLHIGQDAQIWSYLTPQPFAQLDDAQHWILSMLKRAEQEGYIPFTVFDNISGELAGSSSYLDVRVEHAGLEIGFTWYGVKFQRSHVNTATKLALLTEAFETLGANRVQLQTDLRNKKSQQAIERLGAHREGVLRMHKVYPDGYIRDSVIYSITSADWPHVKQKLNQFLDR